MRGNYINSSTLVKNLFLVQKWSVVFLGKINSVQHSVRGKWLENYNSQLHLWPPQNLRLYIFNVQDAFYLLSAIKFLLVLEWIAESHQQQMDPMGMSRMCVMVHFLLVPFHKFLLSSTMWLWHIFNTYQHEGHSSSIIIERFRDSSLNSIKTPAANDRVHLLLRTYCYCQGDSNLFRSKKYLRSD